MGHASANLFGLAVGRGQKVKYHLISITKPISKIIIQWGLGLGVLRGQKSNYAPPSVRHAISS